VLLLDQSLTRRARNVRNEQNDDENDEQDDNASLSVLSHSTLHRERRILFSNSSFESNPSADIQLQGPYRFVVPDFMENLTSTDSQYPLPDIRLAADIRHPERWLQTEVFSLVDFAPVGSKRKISERFVQKHPDRIFIEFPFLSSKSIEAIELARLQGMETKKICSKGKIIEIFFRISLAEMQRKPATPWKVALDDAEGYEQVPADTDYLALDKDLKPMVALFANGFQKAWGTVYGDYIVKTTAENIDKLARFVKPHKQIDPRRHQHHEEWVRDPENQQYPWAAGPNARSGIYYFGAVTEQGHAFQIPVITKDSQGQGSYAAAMVKDLEVWCSNLTQTIDSCFAGLDKDMRDRFRLAFESIPTLGVRLAAATTPQELFSFRALLVNVLTEPHLDHQDLREGYAWLTPFGDFSDGLFCITALRRKVVFQPGYILGIRGDRLEHFTTKWRGSNRYCWVFTFHEQVKQSGEVGLTLKV
jgi:hypothetical protein